MDYLYSILLFVFVIVCLLLLGIILLQTSQTGGMGSIGGGNSSLEGALGGQGADKLLLRTTTIFAVIFMSLAILLNVIDNPTQQYESSIEYGNKNQETPASNGEENPNATENESENQEGTEEPESKDTESE